MSQLIPTRRMGSRSRTRRGGEPSPEAHELRTLGGATHAQPQTRHLEYVDGGEDNDTIDDHQGHEHRRGDAQARYFFPWKFLANPGRWAFGGVVFLGLVILLLVGLVLFKSRKDPPSFQHEWFSIVSLDLGVVNIKTQISVSHGNDTSRKFCSQCTRSIWWYKLT